MRSEDLDHLTQKHAGCLVATYADIEAGITLISAQQKPVAQEVLDTICKNASLRLGTLEQPPFGSETCRMAISVENGQVTVFFRDPRDDSCSFNLVCASSAALPALLRDTLSLIEAKSSGAGA